MTDRPDRWDSLANRAEERRNAFHESEGKPILNEFWATCTKHVDENVFFKGVLLDQEHVCRFRDYTDTTRTIR